MTLTPRGLPYPEPTAPVSAGANDIKALAQAIDPKLGQEFGYREIVAPVAVAGVAGAQTLVIPAIALTCDGTTAMLFEFFAPLGTTGAGGQLLFTLFEGSSAGLGLLGGMILTAGLGVPVHCQRRWAPPAGPHNFAVYAYVNSGSGNVSAGPGGAGNYDPAFLRITKA